MTQFQQWMSRTLTQYVVTTPAQVMNVTIHRPTISIWWQSECLRICLLLIFMIWFHTLSEIESGPVNQGLRCHFSSNFPIFKLSFWTFVMILQTLFNHIFLRVGIGCINLFSDVPKVKKWYPLIFESKNVQENYLQSCIKNVITIL